MRIDTRVIATCKNKKRYSEDNLRHKELVRSMLEAKTGERNNILNYCSQIVSMYHF